MTTNFKDLAAQAREKDPEAFDTGYKEADEAIRLGMMVREAREKVGISQSELARRAHTSQPAIARLEAGGGNATISTISRIAGSLGLDVTVEFHERSGAA